MVTLPPAVTNFEVSNDLNQKRNETSVKKPVFYNTINSFIINSKKYFSPV